MKTRTFPSAGYRVHFDRLRNIRAQTSVIRTHKFLCEIPESGVEDVKKKFEAAGEVVDGSERGSGLWFLVQLAGMGILLPTAGNKLLTYKELFGNDFDFGFPVPNQIALSKRMQTGADSVPAVLKSCLKIWRVSIFEDLPEIPKKILERIDRDRNGRPLGGRATGLNTWVKNIFAEELGCPKLVEISKGEDYAIFNDKFLEWNLEKVDEWIRSGKIPEFEMDDLTFPWFFDHILSASQLLGEKPTDLMNPYHALGTLVREWRTNTNVLRKILEEQIPHTYIKKSDLISVLVRRVAECAQTIPLETVDDFLTQDWSQYRETNFSGRLSTWISNFQNRLDEFQSILADDIHAEELKKWRVPDSVREALLEKNEEGNFVFKSNLSKGFEKQTFDGKRLQDYFFWGKGKEKGGLGKRRDSIENCTANILKRIREGIDFERIFPASSQYDFTQLEELQKPLLRKLRATVLGVRENTPDPRSLWIMIEEYHTYWQPVNEFLARWANEGIPKRLSLDDTEDEGEIVVWDDTAKQPSGKPSRPWIAKSLLVEKKKGGKSEDDDDGEDHETEREIIGKLKKSLVLSELPKYPRFIGQAMKDPELKLRKAAEELPLIAETAERFCGVVEGQRDEYWEDRNWLITRKEKKGEAWKTVWHFGQLHKSLEALKKIAARSRKPVSVLRFLDSFVADPDESFLGVLQNVRGQKAGFDLEVEKRKISGAKTAWENFISDDDVAPERIAGFHFFLSGKEYGFSRYAAVPVRSVSFRDFLDRFEKHFGLSRGQGRDRFLSFLQVENDGVGADAPTQAELLKFWWARRMIGLRENIDVKTFVLDDRLHDQPLSALVEGKEKISRYAAARFLQAGLGASLRGDIELLTRKDFISRIVLQVTNGGQTLLEYVPREWGEFGGLVSAQSLQKKLQRRLTRARNNIAALPSHHPAVAELREREKHLERKIQQLQEGKILGFSDEAKSILKDAGIFGETNVEIAQNIWKGELEKNKKLARVLGEMPHSWNAILKTKQPIDGLTAVQKGLFVEKSQDKVVFDLCTKKERDTHLYSFPIQTSVVQKQFLERFLWGDRQHILIEKIQGPSVILETEKKVSFRNRQPVITDGETKMFVAIPFELSKKKGKVWNLDERRSDSYDVRDKREIGGLEIKSKDNKSQKQYRAERNILGIDLGEYGFGYAILDASIAMNIANGLVTEEDKKRLFVQSGFIPIPLLQKMRDGAESWRDTQATGIFSRPTTYLASLREQAAGTVRNQIHALALKYDAVPIYEDSVDAFEEGGNRIKKLYKTLKTSDIGNFGNDADKALVKRFWGGEVRGKFKNPISSQIGGVIGAAMTSQTCRKCGRCATREIQNHLEKTLRVLSGKVLEEIACDLPDGDHEKSRVLMVIKKFQRVESEEERVARESGKSYRGRSAQFHCQICGSVADADEQAARNIALKYFWKLRAQCVGDVKKWGFQTDEYQKSRGDAKKSKREERQVLDKAGMLPADSQTDAKDGSNFSSLKYFMFMSKKDEWRGV